MIEFTRKIFEITMRHIFVNNMSQVDDHVISYCEFYKNLFSSYKTHSSSIQKQIHIDIGFSGQESKTSDQTEFYKGMNGETCYIGIKDRFSRYLDGDTFVSKSVPLVWL